MNPNAKSMVDSLDLSIITGFMCSDRYPLTPWAYEDAKHLEKLYRRFFWLLVKYPDTPIVPTLEIDEYWHTHILYTKKYFDDCMSICGRYLHHYPADVEESESSKSTRQKHFEHTQKLYFEEFGEELDVFIEDEAGQ